MTSKCQVTNKPQGNTSFGRKGLSGKHFEIQFELAIQDVELIRFGKTVFRLVIALIMYKAAAPNTFEWKL